MDLKLGEWVYLKSYGAEAMRSAVQDLFRMSMAEGVHYIRNGEKPTLTKAGAEMILLNLGMRFRSRVVSSRRKQGDFIVETAIFDGDREMGNGLGFASASETGDANSALKMAKKRSFVDAVISVSGASEFFTQDYGEIAEATRSQIAYIGAIVQKNGISDGDLQRIIREAGAESIDALAKRQASAVISALLRLAGSGGSR
ncbi:hypothetical protein ApAK_03865 [Thermoplasmatales archaeon AK]|nr:hypothetical protein [Thermoplasmatales archaeon AK]